MYWPLKTHSGLEPVPRFEHSDTATAPLGPVMFLIILVQGVLCLEYWAGGGVINFILKL